MCQPLARPSVSDAQWPGLVQDLVKRLSKSAPFLKWNDLNVKVKKLEVEVAKGGGDAEVSVACVCTPQLDGQEDLHGGILFFMVFIWA